MIKIIKTIDDLYVLIDDNRSPKIDQPYAYVNGYYDWGWYRQFGRAALSQNTINRYEALLTFELKKKVNGSNERANVGEV